MIKVTYPLKGSSPEQDDLHAKKKKRERYWMLVFLLGGLIAMGKGSYDAYQALRSDTWSTVEGKIVSSSITKVKHPGETPAYYPDIQYVYQVEGKVYTGNRIFWGEFGSGSPSSAQAVVNNYKVGMSVTVYYDPRNPANAILERGARWASFALLFGGLLFSIVGVVGFLYWDKLKKAAFLKIGDSH